MVDSNGIPRHERVSHSRAPFSAYARAVSTLIGLLVGIDQYVGDVPALQGCRNDIDRAKDILTRYAAANEMDARFATLLDADATRDAVIAGFRTTFADAGPDDAAVFWYSGHGSQQQAPPEHLAFEPDGLDETLVLHDSRTEGSHDLADVELGALVREVAARGVHMFVVLDCCHSGSGLREVNPSATGIRRAPTDRRPRPISSYLRTGNRAGNEAAPTRSPTRGDRLAAESYVLLAACRSDQTAKEIHSVAGTRGALSVALEAALTSGAGPMSYLQLQRLVAAAVSGTVADQTPVLECRPAADADRQILGRRGAGGPLHVVTHGPAGWRLDAGALHGLPLLGLDDQAILLSLHPLDATDLAAGRALARAHVVEVLATSSLLTIDDGEGLDPAAVYRAIVRHLPAAQVTVAVETDVPRRDDVLTRLRGGLGLAVVDPAAAPDLLVRVSDAELTLVRRGVTQPLVAGRPLPDSLTPAALESLRDEAAQVGRWLALQRRTNPTTRIAAGGLALELLDTTDRPIAPQPDGTVRLVCPPDSWPRARIRVANRSGKRLFVSVLALSERYGISTLFDGEGEWLDPGTEVYVPAQDGTPDLYFSLPEGETATTDILLALAATEEFAATPLRQAELDAPTTRGPGGATKGVSRSRPARPPERSDDWTTTQLQVTTVRPTQAARLSGHRATLLSDIVTVQPHRAFTANARLATAAEASREALVPLLPSVLLDDPDSRSFSFLPARDPTEAVDVLELEDLVGAENVTRSDPLILRLPQTLRPGELVFPIMFDGEDYLPVGLGQPSHGATEIRISRLPAQGEITRRSIGGSLKILFRKVVGRRLGAEYGWPHLSAVTYDAEGRPSYDHDPARVRAAATTARSALLLVHGILGDTRGIATAAGPAGADLARDADLVLALDYENLDTAIEVTASDLAAALAQAGITPQTGPRLTILAHSMGGLVSRCFIERQGGAAVTDRLITCGTPHRGSPWPRVEDAVTALLGLALNLPLAAGSVGGVIGAALAGLGRAAESLDTALDQMRPGSDLLTTLDGAPDPGVPYILVRGTLPFPLPTEAARARRIVHKLTGKAIDTLFGNEQHDIAVGVASSGGVGSQWPHPPRIIDAPCNHLSYFTDPTGINALNAALHT